VDLERRTVPRTRLRVVHLHGAGAEPVRRVSELMFVDGRPQAVLGWTQSANGRRPAAVIPLDSARLRASKRAKNLFHYDGVTS
jgi:hypothetical protein